MFQRVAQSDKLRDKFHYQIRWALTRREATVWWCSCMLLVVLFHQKKKSHGNKEQIALLLPGKSCSWISGLPTVQMSSEGSTCVSAATGCTMCFIPFCFSSLLSQCALFCFILVLCFQICLVPVTQGHSFRQPG